MRWLKLSRKINTIEVLGTDYGVLILSNCRLRVLTPQTPGIVELAEGDTLRLYLELKKL